MTLSLSYRRTGLLRCGGVDLRVPVCALLARVWALLEQRQGDGDSGQSTQFSVFARDILRISLSSHEESSIVATEILFSMILAEFHATGDFHAFEVIIVDHLDQTFIGRSKKELDRPYFIDRLRTLTTKNTAEDDTLQQNLLTFLDSLDDFVDLLIDLRNLPADDPQYSDDFTSYSLRLMNFLRLVKRDSTDYLRYLSQLVSRMGESTEGGIALSLQIDVYRWNNMVFLDAIPELGLPRQTEFARKERLSIEVEHFLCRLD